MQEACAFLTPRGQTGDRLIRAVIVGNSMRSAATASDTQKRPLYFTATEGENASALVWCHTASEIVADRCSVFASMKTSYRDPCVSAARTLLGAKKQVLFQARATVYVKEMEVAMHTAIKDLPLGMRLNR